MSMLKVLSSQVEDLVLSYYVGPLAVQIQGTEERYEDFEVCIQSPYQTYKYNYFEQKYQETWEKLREFQKELPKSNSELLPYFWFNDSHVSSWDLI